MEQNKSETESQVVVDIGSSDLIVNLEDASINLRTVNEKNIRDPKENITAIKLVGDVPTTIELKDGKTVAVILRNVLYVPNS